MAQEQSSPSRARRGSVAGIPAATFAAILLSTFLFAVGWPTPAAAQYFGRNKVQYKDLDFQVLKTEHFDIYFYPDRARRRRDRRAHGRALATPGWRSCSGTS